MVSRVVMRLALVLALATGCVSIPDVYTCTTDAQCTGSGSGRCEHSGNCSFPDATCGSGGYRYDSSAGERAGVCVLADADVQVPLDFSAPSAPVHGNCSTSTPDELYEVTLGSAQTVAFDTTGIATDIAVYAGSCPPTNPMAGLCTPSSCTGDNYGRNVQVLAAGTYCVVVAKTAAGASGTLRVFPVNGMALLAEAVLAGGSGSGTASGTTCGAPANPATPSCFTPVGPSVPMLFWHCPGTSFQFAATVMPQSDLTIGLSLREANDFAEDSSGCAVGTAAGGSAQVHGTYSQTVPHWLMIDGAGGGGGSQCGTVNVSFSVQ